ncbi:hypothetical protein A4X09_0g7889, partial [Tilletia walkeri]
IRIRIRIRIRISKLNAQASAPLHGGILSTTSTPASLKEAPILNAHESRPGGTMSDNIHRPFPSQTHPWSTDK